MKKWPVLLACVAVAAVALWLTVFSATEDERVKAVLVELAKVMAVKEDDTILSRTGRLRSKMKDLVEEDVRVSVPDLGVDVAGRNKLEDEASKIGLLYSSADAAIVVRSIKLDAAETMATADATVAVTATRGAERKVDRRDVHFVLRKDSAWRVSTINVAPRPD